MVGGIARRWSPLLTTSTEGSTRGLAVGLLAAWIVAVLVAGLGAVGWLGPNGLLLGVAVLWAGTRILRPERPTPLLPRAEPGSSLLWPTLLAVPILLFDLGWRLPAPPTDWDALTYHLYLPARWLEAGRLLHVPTVFGDPAAAFAPQNGALLFTWWIALSGGDALANVVNVLPGVVLALSIYELGVLCGATRENAALSAVALFWIGPMRSALYEARVDVPMLAFFGASLAFVAHSLDPRAKTPWRAAGLAIGLAAGTKVVGLVLIAPQALMLSVLLLCGRHLRAFATFLALSIAGGGWWYLANIVQFGNPLFPLALRFGDLPLLRGAIPFGAVAGQFHVPIHTLLGDTLPHFFGLAALGLTGIGFTALLASAIRDQPTRPVRLLVAGVALYWALFYFLRLPHNTETRFLLPVVALSLVGCGLLLEPLRRRSPWLVRASWALAFAILYIDVERLPQWRAALASPLEAGVPLAFWVCLLLGTAAAVAAALAAREGSALRRAAGATGASLAALLVALAQQLSVDARPLHHERSRFRAWSPAIRYVDREDPEHRMRIAYTGLNLPYALTGPRIARPVRYVNTQGELDESFYDFWERDPKLAKRQKPGFYRDGGRDDYGQWIRNLEAAEIDWVVIYRLHRQERYISHDEEGFPIERAWARTHPERFALLASGRTFALYHFRGADR